MIEAKQQPWAEAFFRPYVFRLMKRHFSRIVLLGKLPALPPELSVLLLPNHSSWWDGFLVYLLKEKIFLRPLYLMMLEEQLQHYRFFQRLGAYSIAPGKTKSVALSLNYTLQLLQHGCNLVCIFPQGELRPWQRRPLGYQRITDWLLNRLNRSITVLPLGIRLTFHDERKPVALLKFGTARVVSAHDFPASAEMENEMNLLLTEMLELPDGKPEGKILMNGYRGMSDR